MFADFCRFSDDNARAMVNHKIFAYLCAGIDFNSRHTMSIFRHDPRNDRNLHFVQNMCHAMDGNGKQAGIGKNNFGLAFGRRIPLENRFNIRFNVFPDFGNRLEQRQRCLFCPLFHIINLDVLSHSLVLQGNSNLLTEIVRHIFDDDGQIVANIIKPVGLILDIPRINNPQQFSNDIDNDLLIRFIENIQFVDFSLPFMIIVSQNAIDDALYVFGNQFTHAQPFLSHKYYYYSTLCKYTCQVQISHRNR